ncbi:hypothetical protein NHN26_15735 [Rhodovulum tesquicola]|uniref:hypothetical protein n=1 Tax=Rhodovulum tesquicola TaxID=540254 RepID=UPI0020983F95|nr:hypothetical protein [Rhodovulum tesquicola]MCO8146667.1 hypothetical protein [Rhodovulum tesquicola]
MTGNPEKIRPGPENLPAAPGPLPGIVSGAAVQGSVTLHGADAEVAEPAPLLLAQDDPLPEELRPVDLLSNKAAGSRLVALEILEDHVERQDDVAPDAGIGIVGLRVEGPGLEGFDGRLSFPGGPQLRRPLGQQGGPAVTFRQGVMDAVVECRVQERNAAEDTIAGKLRVALAAGSEVPHMGHRDQGGIVALLHGQDLELGLTARRVLREPRADEVGRREKVAGLDEDPDRRLWEEIYSSLQPT